jgi:hypothetical protein
MTRTFDDACLPQSRRTILAVALAALEGDLLAVYSALLQDRGL